MHPTGRAVRGESPANSKVAAAELLIVKDLINLNAILRDVLGLVDGQIHLIVKSQIIGRYARRS